MGFKVIFREGRQGGSWAQMCHVKYEVQVSYNSFVWRRVLHRCPVCQECCWCSDDGITQGKLTNISLCLCVSLLQSGQDGSTQRPTPTRIPMSKGMKAGKPVVAAPGAGNLTKFEPRAETQSMKIELKKSAASSATSLGGGKGWGQWLRGYVVQMLVLLWKQTCLCQLLTRANLSFNSLVHKITN